VSTLVELIAKRMDDARIVEPNFSTALFVVTLMVVPRPLSPRLMTIIKKFATQTRKSAKLSATTINSVLPRVDLIPSPEVLTVKLTELAKIAQLLLTLVDRQTEVNPPTNLLATHNLSFATILSAVRPILTAILLKTPEEVKIANSPKNVSAVLFPTLLPLVPILMEVKPPTNPTAT
jgi:hypothetical protein